MVGSFRVQPMLAPPFPRHAVHIGIYVTIRGCGLVLRPAANFRLRINDLASPVFDLLHNASIYRVANRQYGAR